MNQRETGKKYEQLAAAYLKSYGVEILEQNYRNRLGEIDIIGRHQGYLVFIEVKYRKTHAKGMPEEAVDYRKQQKICRVADYYRCVKRVPEQTPVRYDVVAVCGEHCTWYPNAFDHIYARG